MPGNEVGHVYLYKRRINTRLILIGKVQAVSTSVDALSERRYVLAQLLRKGIHAGST